MGLTYNDFRKGQKLYYGKVKDQFYFDEGEIYKLTESQYFIRCDFHMLPIIGFNPEFEVFRIGDDLVLVFLANHYYTYIKPISVIESKTIEPFEGFEPGKIFNLKNGQKWQQIDGPSSPSYSSGYVRIIDNRKIVVDSWSFYPNVRKIQ